MYLRELPRIDFERGSKAARGTNFDAGRNEKRAGFSMLSPSAGLNKFRGMRGFVLAREPRAADAGGVQAFTLRNGQRSVRAGAAVATSQRTTWAGRFGLQASAGRAAVRFAGIRTWLRSARRLALASGWRPAASAYPPALQALMRPPAARARCPQETDAGARCSGGRG